MTPAHRAVTSETLFLCVLCASAVKSLFPHKRGTPSAASDLILPLIPGPPKLHHPVRLPRTAVERERLLPARTAGVDAAMPDVAHIDAAAFVGVHAIELAALACEATV